MLTIIRIIFFISICIAFQYAKAQTPLNKDNALINRMHSISEYLSLSTVQEQQFVLLEMNQLKSQDSLAKQKLNLEDRKNWLTDKLKLHDQQLKTILTEAQWKKYNEFLETRQQQFLKHSADKKIKTEGIDRNN